MRRSIALLAVCVLWGCSGFDDGTPDGGGGGGGGGGGACPNKISLAVSIDPDGGRDPVATFNADYFVSSYNWVRVPAGAQPGAPCALFKEADRLKHVVVSSSNIIAGKIASGSVSYRSLPVPPSGSEYCWSSSTGTRVCATPDAGTEVPDAPPALTPGQYQVIFFEPGIPNAKETGRATFTVSN